MSDTAPNSNVAGSQPAENARQRFPTFLASQIALGVVGVAILAFGFWQLGPDHEAEVGAPGPGPEQAPEEVADWQFETAQEETPVSSPANSADYARDVEIALGKSRLIVVNGQLSRTRSDLQQLQQALRDWHDTTTALLTNADGSRLASAPRLVERYAALLELPRPTGHEADSLSQQLDVLSAAAERLTPATPPTDEFSVAAERLHGEVHSALEALHSHQAQLGRLIDDAPTVTTSAVSLQEAVDGLRSTQGADMRRRLLTRPWSAGSPSSRRETAVTP